MQSEPRSARKSVWALSISLAATLEIDVSFSSSGYLDVSVHRVPFLTLWIGVRMTGVFPAGFPHSDISGSSLICSSPKLFAAYHVFHRLLVPRHPPCALIARPVISLDSSWEIFSCLRYIQRYITFVCYLAITFSRMSCIIFLIFDHSKMTFVILH